SDSFSRRKNLYKEIKQKSTNPLKLVELKKTSNILEALEAESSESPPNELFYILGLDVLLEDLDQNKKKETLEILQNRPDDFVELNRPLIFAIPIHLVALLRTDAPDFWEWHQGIFLFDEKFGKQELLLHVITDQFFNLFGGETYQRKRELFGLFDSLLKEHQSSRAEDGSLSYIKNLEHIALLFYELGD
ncbi:MAG: hypothetical protein GWN01_13730, partial [Nitrosopumilaceae archaeon]|nr:hypothetical protein [Nitrosopumilaceae archaeon]NIU88331.1 hypothetical protein [Nitrosopumilaceae archaeon]NIV64764.1 hypothetical protein [Nitrosopumilaceae archaeon]NIX62526.1 hypothetical protein [Nitrosopumilaceae archaeon]